MESLVPIWAKRVVDFSTPWTTMATTNVTHILTTGLTAAVGTTVPANAVHGPFDLQLNGGADVLELVGYFRSGSAHATSAVTSSCLAINAWGETTGAIAHKAGALSIPSTSNPTWNTGITAAQFAAQTAGLSQLTVHGSYNTTGTGYVGKTSKGGILSQPVCESFPWVADGTDIAVDDITQFSAWIYGPGCDADANAVLNGSPLSLLPFAKLWLVIRLTYTGGAGGITTPVVTSGGISLIGYRSVNRTNPIEHDVNGVKPQIQYVA